MRSVEGLHAQVTQLKFFLRMDDLDPFCRAFHLPLQGAGGLAGSVDFCVRPLEQHPQTADVVGVGMGDADAIQPPGAQA